ncbi:phosphonate metabolism protein/1,5-bisphosphokinase (PRPP-forming) PhnN [Rhizobium sp. FY34]|uniref:phosphonate metabolism protein/1,5-bisphosphokinase (PRPP-forming) PhnN n=1 Tax=Rhizobium sp. FY34 TaxID=2562309 RepID=UPI001FEE761E|nr:phosphonate metabolism protein/1,5-bisphosphokinase (PRPP-forming) PhnN [Rhizobium sp. FY34]
MLDEAASSRPAGRMIVVVGPSGVGKDTLIQCAAEHFKDHDGLRFVRRAITRSASAGGEDHESLSEAEFEARERDGGFAVSWAAHGLRYGIPRHTLDQLRAGLCLVANGSRSALPLFRQAYADLLVVNVTARPEILAERLVARGRESREDIMARLQRGSLTVRGDYHVETIDNSGAVKLAADRLILLLKDALTPSISE